MTDDRASAEGPAFERKRRPKSYAATGRASDAMSQVRRASVEGLRAALDDLFDAINVVIGEDEEPEYLKPYVKRVRAALRDTGPRPDSGIDHALHYDPSCEECAYLARPVMLPRPDSGIDERIALARAHLSAGEDVAALALLDAVLSTPHDRASAEDINELHSLIAARLALRAAVLVEFEKHKVSHGESCDCDLGIVLGDLSDAALRDTGSRPDSEGPWRDDQGYWLGGMGTPDTGSRPDSGIEPHEHDHDCQSGNGKTHRHEYRHTHPVEHLHRHEHPTDEQVARRIALSTPRTETSDHD